METRLGDGKLERGGTVAFTRVMGEGLSAKVTPKPKHPAEYLARAGWFPVVERLNENLE